MKRSPTLAATADGFLCYIIAISCSVWTIRWCAQAVICRAAQRLRADADALPPPGLDNIRRCWRRGRIAKNTFCLARGDEAVLSQHFGDLGEEASSNSGAVRWLMQA